MISVSFILPCYNYADYLPDAVHSVLQIAESDDEIIIVDDGSVDDTARVVDSLQTHHAMHYVYQTNAGVSAARNHGAHLATGRYLCFLDADDVLLPDGFKALRAQAELTSHALVFGGHTSRHRHKVRAHMQLAKLAGKRQNFMNYVVRRRFSIANGGAALVRRDIALRYPYPESLKVSEDFTVYAWILANETVSCIQLPVVEVRKHDDSLRNQSSGYADIIERLPDIVFDEQYIAVDLMVYKKPFYCRRLLSLFRVQYLDGRFAECKTTYRQAIACRWINLFKWSYLKKYMRAIFQ